MLDEEGGNEKRRGRLGEEKRREEMREKTIPLRKKSSPKDKGETQTHIIIPLYRLLLYLST